MDPVDSLRISMKIKAGEGLKLGIPYLYYYIKQLRIGGSIFSHGIFLLYPFYPSIRQIISIFD
jgi:hypothetical protein